MRQTLLAKLNPIKGLDSILGALRTTLGEDGRFPCACSHGAESRRQLAPTGLLKWSIAACLGAASLTSAPVADAQEWLANRQHREGIGYRVGNLELHPSLAGEFGYDSNMFHRAAAEDPMAVMRLRVSPALSLATLSDQRRSPQGREAKPNMLFRADLGATYNEYIATDSARSSEASEFRNIGGNLGADLELFPGRVWGGHLYGGAIRTIQPSNLSDTRASFDRINARGGAEIVWAPGGGMFDWRVGYEYGGTFFEKDYLRGFDNHTHSLQTRGRWRFLPRTALLFDASQSFVQYPHPNTANFLLNSQPIRARLGLKGLLSNRFALLAMAGWGSTFLEPGLVPAQDYDGPIGQAELSYYPTSAPGLTDTPREVSLTLSKLSLGYMRDFQPSYLGGHYSLDRGYVNGSYFFAGRVLGIMEVGVARVGFPTTYFAATTAGGAAQVRAGSFADTRIDASLGLEYRVLDSLGINASGRYDQSNSAKLPVAPSDPTLSDDLSFKRFQVYAGIRWFM